MILSRLRRYAPGLAGPRLVRQYWFWLILACYIAYALAFIYNSSAVLKGKRYFVLLDDAMISMTYGRTLAHGHGAVWYPGADPVQGYSNPSWMLLMALVHCFPLPPSLTSLPVQLLGVVLVAGTLVFVKLIADRLALESASLAPPPGTREGHKRRHHPSPPSSHHFWLCCSRRSTSP